MGFDLIAAVDWNYLFALSQTILKVAAGLGFVVFVHELGHFLVAKACGVKCEKFYIGFDIPMPFGIPSRFCRFQWGETEYGVGILPLGGYVKMLGQDDNPMRAEEEAERTRIRSAASDDASAERSAVATATDSATATVRDNSSTPVTTPTPSTAAAASQSAATSVQAYELDPRSYTAKAVWQRMLIISAGVIMNLIFAVIFAAYAYRQGVPYTPCEIGEVIAGGPAWEAGVEPGTRLVQIGADGKKRDTLRFDFDLRQSVATHGDKSDLALLFRDQQGNEQWKNVRPFTMRHWIESSSTIGVAPAFTNRLADRPASPATAAASATPELKGGDRVIGINELSSSDPLELNNYLAAHAEGTLKLRIQRTSSDGGSGDDQVLDVYVPPQKLLDFGIITHHGAIRAIRPESPAAKAGFQEGDIPLAINGKTIENGLLLPELIRPFYGKEIEVAVTRPGQNEPVTLRVTPEPPQSYEYMLMPGCYMASDALGIGYEVTRQVRAVVPGSAAEKAGMKPDDLIASIMLKWEKPGTQKESFLVHDKAIELDDRQSTWPIIYHQLQSMVSGEVLELTYVRGGKPDVVSLKPTYIDAYNPNRGLRFEMKTDVYAANSWREAAFLGVRQTWEDAFRVVSVLKKLVTGQVSVANLGGLGSIAYVAGKETEEGTTRLLIFLTMLSANLAVLNFLPIPALDGGHMMFLLYEAVFRKPVNERLQFALTLAGVACLLGLMLFVNAMDIRRFLF